jgi:predicted ATPase
MVDVASRVACPVFIGRRDELERLRAALAAAADGRPQTILVAGEAGVGKTRLVSEFVAGALTDGARVLSGGCLPIGEHGLPFAPIVEALRGLTRSLDQQALDRLLGRARGELARLVPDLGPGLPTPAATESGDGWAQGRLFELLLGFLGRLSVPAPVVLVLEDIHWAARRAT